MTRVRLPSVLGMMLFGIIAGPLIRTNAPQIFWDIAPHLRSTALIIILLRAGLGIRKEALKQSGVTAALLSVIPCMVEGFTLTAVFYFLWGFDLFTAGAAGFLLSAVSPAVVVPSMLSLMESGYGRKNEVPTTVLAGASVDDVFAITLFTVFLNLAVGAADTRSGLAGVVVNQHTYVLTELIKIPLGLLGAVGFGVIVGLLLAAYFKRHFTNIRATEKFMLLLAISIMFVEVGNYLHLAALLGIMTIGFILVEKADYIAHELAQKLSKAWVIAEILLFVLIGAVVNTAHAVSVGLPGLAAISAGLAARSIGVLLSVSMSRFTWKERIFCVLAYFPKATVQAALGSIPLALGLPHGEIILSLAVLSILFTAPLGLISIRVFGPRLLGIEMPSSDDA